MKIVVGLGLTGVSCVEYLLSQGNEVIAMDSSQQPSGYADLQKRHPGVRCLLGEIDKTLLAKADEIIVSPGVPLEKVAVSPNVPVIGDIELFARAAQKPIYAITGSNGKTTVTTLVGEMAKAAQADMAVAGNIGTPVLELLKGQRYQGYILELSSFQLDTTYSLHARAATVLNVTPDHLDRYRHFNDYLASKQRIYFNCDYPIVNADETWIWESLSLSSDKISFSVKHHQADYFLETVGGKVYLNQRGTRVLDTDEMLLKGIHHWQNALAALAFGEVMQLPLQKQLQVLKTFSGLPHRCQWVRKKDGVDWYNDSKATNVGAAETAIRSLGAQMGKVILLAGGLGKGADFSCLRECVQQHVSHAILFGKDAPHLAEALQAVTQLHFVKTLQEAVLLADSLAQAGDKVLLAPACASFDMFLHYGDRGNQFMEAVAAL